MTILPRSILGRTLLMAFGVALIGAATSLILLFTMPPPSSPPLSVYELGRLARGLPIANEDDLPDKRVVRSPGSPKWPVDPERSALFTQLIVGRTHLPPGSVRIEIAYSRRYPDSAQRLVRQIRMYGLEDGANPYLFDSMRLIVRRHDGKWTIIERIRPNLVDTWRWLSAGWILAGLALVLPIALLFANRLARPIRKFADASAKLGADADAAPIPVSGPTEIVEAASAFNRMQERIRRHLAERTTTIAAVAHDLRTPLARLRFRLEGTAEPLRGKAIADLEEMEAMIAATLRLARDEGASATVTRLDLAPLLGQVAAAYREQGSDVSAAIGGPLPVSGDAIALRRLVENLINNAIRFGNRASLEAHREHDRVALTVTDDGPGMSEESLARAFDPFWRAEGSRNRGTGGTGLGLTIVEAIARRHGGTATLANRDGGGLVATVELPLAA